MTEAGETFDADFLLADVARGAGGGGAARETGKRRDTGTRRGWRGCSGTYFHTSAQCCIIQRESPTRQSRKQQRTGQKTVRIGKRKGKKCGRCPSAPLLIMQTSVQGHPTVALTPPDAIHTMLHESPEPQKTEHPQRFTASQITPGKLTGADISR